MSVLAWLFPKVLFPKEVATETSRMSFFRTRLGINVLTGSKQRWKMEGITTILFPYEFQVNWVGKSLIYSDLKS